MKRTAPFRLTTCNIIIHIALFPTHHRQYHHIHCLFPTHYRQYHHTRARHSRRAFWDHQVFRCTRSSWGGTIPGGHARPHAVSAMGRRYDWLGRLIQAYFFRGGMEFYKTKSIMWWLEGGSLFDRPWLCSGTELPPRLEEVRRVLGCAADARGPGVLSMAVHSCVLAFSVHRHAGMGIV